MREHVFISYASADGDRFAERLHSRLKKKKVEVWWDTLSLRPSEGFNRSIDRGLQEAKAILVLLTKGAVLSLQVEGEWNEALNHFTPIFPLLMQSCEIPRTLSVLQYIDFTQSYSPALNELVDALHKLDENYLDHLKQLHSAFLEAQRDAPNPDRFKDKIRLLRSKIKSFKQQTNGVSKSLPSRPLQSARTVKRKKQSRVRVVGRRPDYDAELFKDREYEQEKIYRLLMEDSTRIASIIGRGGMGKTALVARVLSGLEQNGLSHTDGKVDGILYLSTRTFGVSLERLFLDCQTMIGGARAAALRRVWENPLLEPEEKGLRLLKTLSGSFYIILLDNLEDILDDKGNLQDTGLRSLIDNFLQMKSSSRILITSRIPLALPAELSRFDHRIYLQEGLPVAEAVAMLRD
ncbi:MAG TPA: TIR domain-containing protein, partial [Blastocatellia bacterium]|nr:TIR domain-containing protein [Blastocatellia bacterium]